VKHLKRIVILGFGALGQAMAPALRARFPHCRIHVIDAELDAPRAQAASQHGFSAEMCRVDASNYREVLAPHLAPGALVLNLANSLSSRALLEHCQQMHAFYLDTHIDDWATDALGRDSTPSANSVLRENIVALKARSAGRSTAVVAHGANPGFVSVLVKKALLMMAAQFFPGTTATPITRLGWARLAQRLDVRVMQISQHDTQTSEQMRETSEFVNTWSVPGLIDELQRPAELGWGSHERTLPDAAHPRPEGARAAIALAGAGRAVEVRSWAPMSRDFTGMLLRSSAAISLADYFSIVGADAVSYRPTTFGVYRPCAEARSSIANFERGDRFVRQRIIKGEITSGVDELGVLLVSGTFPALWFGSILSIDKAREFSAYHNATSLQAASGALAAIEWIVEHPDAGILEAEDLDHDFIFARASRYWEPLVHEFRSWSPAPRGASDACQFADFLVQSRNAARKAVRGAIGDVIGGASDFGAMAFA
jgi:homospermidine synthase